MKRPENRTLYVDKSTRTRRTRDLIEQVKPDHEFVKRVSKRDQNEPVSDPDEEKNEVLKELRNGEIEGSICQR